ncbi:MAG: nicotinamide riboside transporter PnuC [Bacteroidales bacterium]|jgi:nicotinamide riboside transporter PnuC|nr:nicotinamide riboside transporter PnuC [Bacteroidales bacterium]
MFGQWFADNGIELFGAVAGILYVFLEVRQNRWLWFVGIVTSAVYIYVFFGSKLYADMSLQAYYLAISFIGWYWWSHGRRAQGGGHGAGGREQGPVVGENDERRTTNGVTEITSREGSWVVEAHGRGHRAEGMEQAARSKGQGQEGREEERGRRGEKEKGREGGEAKDGSRGSGRMIKVTHIRRPVALILLLVLVILFAIIWFILSEYTDSPVPVWDSFITSLSIVATWMLARKIYEHWYLWIIVNLVSAVLFTYRGLYPTVVLYIVYCVMSFEGLRQWRKTIGTSS